MHHNARTLTSLLGLLTLVANTVSGSVEYGQLCTTSAECASNICSYIAVDDSYQMNYGDATLEQTDLKTERYGVCVQCQDDCDCPVNQYCSVDEEATIPDWNDIITTANLNPGNGLTPASRKKALAIALAWKQIKIRSKCKEYSLPSTTCTVLSSEEELMAYDKKELIELSSGSKVKLHNKIERWPKSVESSFCGKVNWWAPRKHERAIVVSSESGELKKDATRSEALAKQLGDHGLTERPDNLDSFTKREGDAAFCFPDLRYESDADTNCDSCLYNRYSSSCTGLPDDSCDCQIRNDAPVCCINEFYWSSDWSAKTPADRERRCSRPWEQFPWEEGANKNAWTTTSDSNYASCATACKPGSFSRNFFVSGGRGMCYEADGRTSAILPDVPAVDDPEYVEIRTIRQYCACVFLCEQCVDDNGGCGRNNLPSGITGEPYHNLLWGTCTGSCKPATAPTPAPTPAPTQATFNAEQFTCNEPSTATPTSAPLPRWDHCLPKCVDCLAKAKAQNCDEDGNGCRSIKPWVTTERSFGFGSGETHPGCVSALDDYHAKAYAGSVKIQAAVPVIDFAGQCVNGQCQICKSGSLRCQSKGVFQECLEGRWYEYAGNNIRNLSWNEHVDTAQAVLADTRTSLQWIYSILAFVVFLSLLSTATTIFLLVGKPPMQHTKPAPVALHSSAAAPFDLGSRQNQAEYPLTVATPIEVQSDQIAGSGLGSHRGNISRPGALSPASTGADVPASTGTDGALGIRVGI